MVGSPSPRTLVIAIQSEPGTLKKEIKNPQYEVSILFLKAVPQLGTTSVLETERYIHENVMLIINKNATKWSVFPLVWLNQGGPPCLLFSNCGFS